MKLIQDSSHVNAIQQEFMMSGHSYLPNNSDFGLIELSARGKTVYLRDDSTMLWHLQERRIHLQQYIEGKDFFCINSGESHHQKIEKQKKKISSGTLFSDFAMKKVGHLRFCIQPDWMLVNPLMHWRCKEHHRTLLPDLPFKEPHAINTLKKKQTCFICFSIAHLGNILLQRHRTIYLLIEHSREIQNVSMWRTCYQTHFARIFSTVPGFAPVSYTHLDVYKRQIVNSVPFFTKSVSSLLLANLD